MVIRNHQGLVIAFLSQKFSQAFAPMKVETLAAARALEFAAKLGITHAFLEGDSQMLIQACGLLLYDVRYRFRFFTPLSVALLFVGNSKEIPTCEKQK